MRLLWLCLVGLCAFVHALADDENEHEMVINATDIHEPVDIMGEHESLAKVWTIASTSALKRLHVEIPGRAFVLYAPEAFDDENEEEENNNSTVVAQVVISGTSEDLIDAIEIKPLDAQASDGLRLHLKNQKLKAKGYLLCRILVRYADQLHQVMAAVADTVVLDAQTLVTTDPHGDLLLSNVGDGDLLVTSPAFNETGETNTTSSPVAGIVVGSLSASVAGGGTIQLQLPTVQTTHQITLNVAGNGNIALLSAGIATRHFEASIAGSGRLYVDTPNLATVNLVTTLAGSGAASFDSTGSCLTQRVSVVGAAEVLSGSIVCNDTDVSLWGPGDVIVQTIHSLKASVSFTGVISYVGEPPEHIQVSGIFAGDPALRVMEAEENRVYEYEALDLPAQEPLHVKMKLKRAYGTQEPKIKKIHTKEQQVLTNWIVETHQTAVPRSWWAYGASALVAVGLMVLVMAVVDREQRRRRSRTYARLLS